MSVSNLRDICQDEGDQSTAEGIVCVYRNLVSENSFKPLSHTCSKNSPRLLLNYVRKVASVSMIESGGGLHL